MAYAGMNDFVMIGVYEGYGVRSSRGGKLLLGKDMMAGELGHVTVDLNGQKCGCGNTGCLETVATDPAFARAAAPSWVHDGDREIVQLSRDGKIDVTEPLDRTLEYLGVGIAAAINIFNPQAVLVCPHADAQAGRVRSIEASVSSDGGARDAQRLQDPPHKATRDKARSRCIIQHLTHALWPAID